MNCTHCGAPIAGNSKFCTKCGTPVAAAPNIDEAETSVLNQNNNLYGAGTGAQKRAGTRQRPIHRGLSLRTRRQGYGKHTRLQKRQSNTEVKVKERKI